MEAAPVRSRACLGHGRLRGAARAAESEQFPRAPSPLPPLCRGQAEERPRPEFIAAYRSGIWAPKETEPQQAVDAYILYEDKASGCSTD